MDPESSGERFGTGEVTTNQERPRDPASQGRVLGTTGPLRYIRWSGPALQIILLFFFSNDNHTAVLYCLHLTLKHLLTAYDLRDLPLRLHAFVCTTSLRVFNLQSEPYP
jgi:hypothetical protein